MRVLGVELSEVGNVRAGLHVHDDDRRVRSERTRDVGRIDYAGVREAEVWDVSHDHRTRAEAVPLILVGRADVGATDVGWRLS